MSFQGNNAGFKKWTRIEKLEYDIKLHRELNKNYEIISKLVIICDRKKIPLIIENPFTTQHYLTRYWCIKPKIIDYDRTKKGDYFVKPTQYFFINREPSLNIIPEGITLSKRLAITNQHGIGRSLISKEYAKRFILENIL